MIFEQMLIFVPTTYHIQLYGAVAFVMQMTHLIIVIWGLHEVLKNAVMAGLQAVIHEAKTLHNIMGHTHTVIVLAKKPWSLTV